MKVIDPVVVSLSFPRVPIYMANIATFLSGAGFWDVYRVRANMNLFLFKTIFNPIIYSQVAKIKKVIKVFLKTAKKSNVKKISEIFKTLKNRKNVSYSVKYQMFEL